MRAWWIPPVLGAMALALVLREDSPWGALVGVDSRRPCPAGLASASLDHTPECYFSDAYAHARAKFRAAAEQNGLAVHVLWVDPVQDLSVDVAVVNGSDPSALCIHISGTHGVEGFVGSAIQTAALHHMAKLARNATTRLRPPHCTTLFVHALNPFGMAHLRRFNEENVDLNRNALFTDELFETAMGRTDAFAGYARYDAFLNPAEPPSTWSSVKTFARLLRAVVEDFGTSKIKRALVTATYQTKRGIYFGGRRIQTSHQVVRDFLLKHYASARITSLRMVDVHSGLGPMGRDTFFLSPEAAERTRQLFGDPDFRIPGAQHLGWVAPDAMEAPRPSKSDVKAKYNAVVDGYGDMIGDALVGYSTLFPSAEAQGNVVSIAQEFGTVPVLWVLWQTILENQAWNFAESRQAKLRAGEALRFVFEPGTQRFTERAIHRGLLVVFRMMQA